ncbi:RNHCP domain-containing protein [Nonomuraea aridisoli]|uniref:RNHCP domain-containing protein n=1 Tax=Nonomuraea aridisoli TaxID=2070368 RepID=A0A2W2EWG0_9ACTN|nr:RNHCP domain-containing protein [Nonomuraea aridisoli]PZG21199.1 hypothetical protein C1J01_06995 [Nonomuraea aridisoli]
MNRSIARVKPGSSPNAEREPCRGMMRPERAEHRGGKGLVLVHRCVVCGFVRPNRVADDPVQGDDIDAIIALMSVAG